MPTCSLWVVLAGIAESSTSPTTVPDDYLFDWSFKNVPNGYQSFSVCKFVYMHLLEVTLSSILLSR